MTRLDVTASSSLLALAVALTLTLTREHRGHLDGRRRASLVHHERNALASRAAEARRKTGGCGGDARRQSLRFCRLLGACMVKGGERRG